MALCDYRLCDVCGGKAFYDANLNYSEDKLHSEQKLVGFHYLDWLGAWKVLCINCVDTHEITVTERTNPQPEREE